MHSNCKMASGPVNSDVDMAEFEKQKKEIKELLDTQMVEGDAWYITCGILHVLFLAV